MRVNGGYEGARRCWDWGTWLQRINRNIFLKKFLPWKVNNICYTLDFIDDAVLCQTEDKKY